MDKKTLLEQMARETWERLNRAEDALGINSPEANMLRAEWSGLNRAFLLVYEERIDYFDIKA